MKTILLACIALCLTACGSLVTTDQLTAAAASKNRMASLCVKGNPSVLGGISALVYSSVDADVVKAGTVTVSENCQMSFSNSAPVTPVAPVVVPAK